VSLLSAFRGDEKPRDPEPVAIPPKIDERLRRGRQEMLKLAAKRRLCERFEKGDTYFYVDNKNILQQQATVTYAGGGGKQPHRIRNTFNFIRPIIEDKVSKASSRIPGYEVTATTTDLPDAGAAALATKVARYGYDKWRLRDVTVDACTLAIGHGGDAFAFPYFDSSVGPFVQVGIDEFGEPDYQGIGEVKVLVLSGNEAYWEAGVKFLESRWYAFDRAEAIETVQDYPGYMGGALNPDATTGDVPRDGSHSHMVLVTNYLERPSAKNPEGRWLVFANGRQVIPEQTYPLKDADGTVLDEPCLHRLRYRHDPSDDRDLGLTWQLVDPQRTFQDAYNKAVEWKNRVLVPQILAPRGSIKKARTDEPGAIIEYDPIGGMTPQWEQVQQIPESLFRIAGEMKNFMRELGAFEDIQADPNLAAKTVQEVVVQSDSRWGSFLGDLAEWHSRVMRHCLLLVSVHYSEPRTLSVQGTFGPDFVPDFRGAQLMGQVNVTVDAASLKARSRQEIQNKVTWIAQTFPGYLTPEQAIKALDSGNDELLVQSYELDHGRAWNIIRKIRDGTVMEMPTRDQTDALGNPVMEPVLGPDGMPLVDPMTGVPVQRPAVDPETGLPPQVPTFMPDIMDDEQVWLQLFADWMKTKDYDLQSPEAQAIARNIYTGILQQRNEKQQQKAQQEQAMAEQMGMSNAAKTPDAKALPSLPKITS
jgi:hypothetical protein